MVSEEALAWAIMLDRVEWLPRPLMAQLQLERLRETVGRAVRGRPAGAERLAAAGVATGAEVRSLDDLRRLPFLTKADLQAQYPFGSLTAPRGALVSVQTSTVARGAPPVVVAYTRADLERQTELITRCLRMAGVRAGMLIYHASGDGVFAGGPGFGQGAERVGAAVAPVSGKVTGRHAMLLADLGAHVLVSTPSYALAIVQELSDQGMDPEELGLELGLFGGEPLTAAVRADIERKLELTAVNVYGPTALCAPGVAAECLEGRDGLHVHEDHFLLEMIDSRDGQPVAPGVDGELVLTTLSREAMPLIRYRTGDTGHVVDEPCGCGRNTVRLRGVLAAHDDTLTAGGVGVSVSARSGGQVLLTAARASSHAPGGRSAAERGE